MQVSATILSYQDNIVYSEDVAGRDSKEAERSAWAESKSDYIAKSHSLLTSLQQKGTSVGKSNWKILWVGTP